VRPNRASKHGRNPKSPLRLPAQGRTRLRILIIQLCLLSTAALYWLAQPPQPVQAFSNTIVISQVYGGGGNAGPPSALYKNDFIELYNRGTTTVSLTGWSVQYAAAGGSSWTKTDLSGSIAPGKYYLIQEDAGSCTTGLCATPLPSPDITTGTLVMATGAGKVALVNNTTLLSGACPSSATIVDFVGYGSAATCAEPIATPSPTGTLANDKAAIRKGHSGNAYQETDNNSSDFVVATPMPRNNASTGTNPGSVLISEVRLRGPNGQNDEFIELYNNTDSPITISDSSPTCAAQILTNPLDPNPTAVCGWAIVDLQGGTAGPFPRVVIPSTPPTTIPARGHYLVANNSSPGYSLGTYATPDLTYTTPGYSASNADYTGLALFSTADRAQFNTTNRLDAVGFYGVNSLYREGNGLSSLTGTTVDGEYSFVRKVDISTAQPQDTGDNAADFVFVATTGATFNATTLPLQGLLGAPGPENLNSPIKRNITASGVGFAPGLVDPNCGSTVAPNQTKATTSFGDTLKIRRKYTNNTGGTVNRLRFRVVDITTLNSPNLYSGAAQADVRAVTSTLETVTLVCSGNGTQDVQGLTLEYADGTNKPDQSVNFGGHNSSVAAGSLSGGVITLTTPLANGDSIYVNFWIKIVSGGKFRFAWILEAN
jgi:hypothetical protein